MKNVLSWIVNAVVFMICFVGGIVAFKYAFQEGNALLASLMLFGSGAMCVTLIAWIDELITNKK